MQCFMLFSRILVILLAAHCALGKCPAQGTPYEKCASTSIIVLDTTTNLGTIGVYNEINYVETNIMPKCNWGQQSVGVYGVSGNIVNREFSTSMATVCEALDEIDAKEINRLSSISLAQTLQVVASHTTDGENAHVVLFSAETNAQAIKDAASIIAPYVVKGNMDFSVVALNGAPFTTANFPAKAIYNVNFANILAGYPGLPGCLLKNMCGDYSECNITTLGPTPSPSPNVENSGQCNACNYSTVWNNIMLLVDNSEAFTQDELDIMMGAVQSQLGQLTIQTPTKTKTDYHSQLGLVTYGSPATTVKKLGSLDNAALENLPITVTTTQADLQDGLTKAANELETGLNARLNARNVILIVTNSYRQNGLLDPIVTASAFKDKGGVIIVYESNLDQTPIKELQNIASKGYYYISSTDQNGDNMLTGLCEANCFCPSLTAAASINATNDTPEGGCYFSNGGSLNYQLAKKTCAKNNNAFIALDKTDSKTTSLQNQIDQYVKGSIFWIGLVYDATKKAYVWEDSTTLDENAYAPWASYIDPTTAPVNTFECVFVNSTKWVQAGCQNSRRYVCELAQCDSTNYCP